LQLYTRYFITICFYCNFMNTIAVSERQPPNTRLLAWCAVGSLLAHALTLTVLPGWKAAIETPPVPLTVELREPPPPEIVLPKLLPMETQPVPRERPKPALVKPEPAQATPREERPVEQPRTAPILTAPPDAPVTAATPVVPEQKPAPPPSEPPRAPPAPVAAPAPVTPPRSDASYLNNPRPQYPLAARRRGDHGTVLVRVLVTAEGLAASVGLEKTSGHPTLDEAALIAVKAWRFVPAKQGGQAIESPYVVPVVFKLE
jgi:periplasmic protein TonB